MRDMGLSLDRWPLHSKRQAITQRLRPMPKTRSTSTQLIFGRCMRLPMSLKCRVVLKKERRASKRCKTGLTISTSFGDISGGTLPFLKWRKTNWMMRSPWWISRFTPIAARFTLISRTPPPPCPVLNSKASMWGIAGTEFPRPLKKR